MAQKREYPLHRDMNEKDWGIGILIIDVKRLKIAITFFIGF
jgi:hypothetical protein